MGRLRRFQDFRFVGRRDLMLVYDCDDQAQFEELQSSVIASSLDESNRLQAFAPDALAEARNRGFRSP